VARGIVERVRLGLSTYGIHLGVGCVLVVGITSWRAATSWPWTLPAEQPLSHTATAPRPEPQGDRAEVASVTRVEGQHVGVDVVASSCHVGVECVVRLQLIARGSYHVNREYPHKFVAETPEARTFRESRDAFRNPGEDVTMLMVTFVPDTAGSARLSGQMKTSVCDDETCVIETPWVSIVVPVS
jgi:hypothetical protein